MVGSGVGRLKHFIPFAQRWAKQKPQAYGHDPLDDESLLADAIRMVAALKSAGAQFEGSTVVEIGTGRTLLLPLVLRMADVGEVITVDRERLVDVEAFRRAVRFIRKHLDRLLARQGRDGFLNSRRLIYPSAIELLEAMCRRSGITYLAPADFLELPQQSGDYIVSHTLLDHIPMASLPGLFEHAAKVLKPGGLMCHMIVLGSHFGSVDTSRRFEYARLLEQSGWEIVSAVQTPDGDLPIEEAMIIARPPLAGRTGSP